MTVQTHETVVAATASDAHAQLEASLEAAWRSMFMTPAQTTELVDEIKRSGPYENQPRVDAILATMHAVRESTRADARGVASSPAIPTEHLADDGHWLARAYLALGLCDLSRGAYDEAFANLQHSLAINESIDDRAGCASSLHNIARVRLQLGDTRGALEDLTRALAIRMEVGERQSIASTLAHLANVHRDLGDLTAALDFANRALDYNEQIGNRAGIAFAHESLGRIYAFVPDHSEAIAHYERSLAIRREIGQRYNAAVSLNAIGVAHLDLGNYTAALENLSESYAINMEVGSRAGAAVAINNIGRIHYMLGDAAKALECYEESLAIEESIGDRAGVGATTNNIALMHQALSEYDSARANFEIALAVESERGDRPGAALVLNNIGKLCFEIAKYDEAIEFSERSLAIAIELGNRERIGAARSAIGKAYNAKGMSADALSYLEQALIERRAIGDRKGLGETMLAIGDVQRSMGLPGSAEASYQQALEVFRSLGHRTPEMELLERIAMLQRDAGLHEEAFANIVEHHRVKSELQSEDVRRRLNTAEARRNLEVATKEAEIERLRNIELADANQQLQQAHDRLAAALSELQLTQSQLVHAEKMSSLGQLTAGIAHEINNPINFIHASALPLRRDLDEIRSAVADAIAGLPDDLRASVEAELQSRSVDELRDEIDALLRGIEDGANRTAVIVQGLRTFSRLDEGDQKHVDLHEGLDAALALLAVRMQGVDVIRDYGELPLVECAPGQINQVFMNILSNAIDAVGSHSASDAHAWSDANSGSEARTAIDANSVSEVRGTITVRTSCVDSRVQVSITDTGCGIEDANLPRIFDPFFTTKPVGKGQGLGLAIAHGIVHRHGGAIAVESVVGDGSTFTVTLTV